MKKKTKYNWKKHLFRASSFGMLMGGSKEISETQLKKITTLEESRDTVKGLNKGDTAKFEKLKLKAVEEPENIEIAEAIKEFKVSALAKKGLTEKQQLELDGLIDLRDNPLKYLTLSKGAKTYLRKLRREVKFNRYVPLESKYLTKGIELEEEAIRFLSVYHDEIFENNKERKTNAYWTGESDVIDGFDTKVAFWLDSLPDPDEALKTIYEYQNRVYMVLWKLEQWTTSAIALNHTDASLIDMIYREDFKPQWKGKDVADWRKVEIIKTYIYDEENFFRLCNHFDCTPDSDSEEKHIDMFMGFVEIPEYERIVEKTVIRDRNIEKTMIQVVKLARKYLQELEDDMWSKRIIK